MLALCEGVEMTIKKVRYFIQVRVILHGYDTKAMQPLLRVRAESAKLTPCPLCRCSFNCMNSYLGSVAAYENLRHLLPYSHYLRAFGQTQKCCPAGQHRAEGLLDPATHAKLPYLIGPRSVMDDRASRELLESCEADQLEFDEEWQQFIADVQANSVTYSWFHETVDRIHFRAHFLYFANCDYRAKKKYSRVTNQQYLRDAFNALDENLDDSEGVVGAWWYAILPYVDVSTQLCWDIFHTLLNISRYTLFNWKGEREVSAGALLYCWDTQLHHYLNPIPKTLTPEQEKEAKAKVAKQPQQQEAKQHQAQGGEVLPPKKRRRSTRRGENSDDDKNENLSIDSVVLDEEEYKSNRADKNPAEKEEGKAAKAAAAKKQAKFEARGIAHAAMSGGFNQYRPWVLPAKYQEIIELCVDAMLVPIGYSRHCQVKKMFKQTGHLNGTEKFK